MLYVAGKKTRGKRGVWAVYDQLEPQHCRDHTCQAVNCPYMLSLRVPGIASFISPVRSLFPSHQSPWQRTLSRRVTIRLHDTLQGRRNLVIRLHDAPQKCQRYTSALVSQSELHVPFPSSLVFLCVSRAATLVLVCHQYYGVGAVLRLNCNSRCG